MAWRSSGTSNISLVENLCRNGLIRSDPVKNAFLAVDRAWFVPSSYKAKAYEDRPLPIGYNATISAPHMHAEMTDAIYKGLKGQIAGKTVLDVGSGSGYLTAVFSNLVGSEGNVYGIEHIPELVDSSKTVITSHIRQICLPHSFTSSEGDSNKAGTSLPPSSSTVAHQPPFSNVKIVLGDGRRETLPEGLPFHYDAIHVGAAVQDGSVPPILVQRLKPGGVLVVPVGQVLHVVTRAADGVTVKDKATTGVCFVPLTSRDTQLHQWR